MVAHNTSTYMYTCIYIYTYVYIYMYIYTHTCIRKHVYVCVNVHVCVYVCVYAHVNLHAYVHVYAFVYPPWVRGRAVRSKHCPTRQADIVQVERGHRGNGGYAIGWRKDPLVCRRCVCACVDRLSKLSFL